MEATQKDVSVLTHLFPPGLWSMACDVRMAKHGMRSIKIPVKGRFVV
jgi:hypothetical protein